MKMKNPFRRKKSDLDPELRKKINRRNFISFTTFFALSGAAYFSWRWLYKLPDEPLGVTGGAKVPLRKAMNKTEVFFRNFFSNKNLVKTYPKEMAAKKVRINSYIGIDDMDFDPASWKLQVIKKSGETLNISLDELRQLPKTEIVFDFKCVEGWDQISYWGGVKFTDFVKHYNLEEETKLQYVGMATPNKEYYVGMDMESVMHPQTILAYEMNEQPLEPAHGQPLRLIVPVKYGIKNLKRIGFISFSNQRVPDYWAEQGYDYYSGL